MERQSRKRKEDDPSYKYICELCGKAYQKTNDLKDHNYVDHLGKTYDCESCIKHYKSEKALKTHIRTQHDGVGRVKCTEEGFEWKSKDTGTLHNHLLTVHEIGEPIKCNMINSDGQKCGKVFINTRSFTEHKDIHRLKNVECSLCNRMFSSEERRVAHVKKYHLTGTQENTYQCKECGQTFHSPDQLGNHILLHKLKKHKELKAQKAAEKKAAERKAKRVTDIESKMDVEEVTAKVHAEGAEGGEASRSVGPPFPEHLPEDLEKEMDQS